jgi:hypothetical protein
MQLVFTKRAGKMDELVATRSDGSRERIECPKQGMIPHEMVHYAVERVLAARGFLSKLGEEGPCAMSREAVAEAIERMVETMQAAVWSGGATAQEILDLYTLGCEARGHAALPVNADQIAAIRTEMDALAARWNALGLGESLALSFDALTD